MVPWLQAAAGRSFEGGAASAVPASAIDSASAVAAVIDTKVLRISTLLSVMPPRAPVGSSERGRARREATGLHRSLRRGVGARIGRARLLALQSRDDGPWLNCRCLAAHRRTHPVSGRRD